MNIRVRVAGVLTRGDEILFVKHQKNGQEYWLLPGGGVDYGETMEESLIREFMEECNIEVEVGNLMFISQGISPDKSKHIINMFFKVRYLSGDLKIGDEERLKEVAYHNIDEINNMTLYPNVKKELLNYFEGDKEIKYLGHRWE
ncbi:NUDIX hydrolase [uncultured Ilyobacter sp.]|uniref:NUDIX hydrolase n=1 Tax=uncultured Ilyobacter sp. TaxID=544433 RepID=UPI0029C7BF0C|nr:NUDIX hydrolase [uncultured Ilyobacter sp.]